MKGIERHRLLPALIILLASLCTLTVGCRKTVDKKEINVEEAMKVRPGLMRADSVKCCELNEDSVRLNKLKKKATRKNKHKAKQRQFLDEQIPKE